MENTYLILAIIVFIIAHIGTSDKYRTKIIMRFCIILIFIILVIFSGFRTPNIFGDTIFYAHSYELLAQNPVISFSGKDPGFTLLSINLIRFTSNPQILIFFTAFITNLFNILAIHKYTRPFDLGILLYFGTVLYYGTMTGIRQSMVAAVLFWATSCILKGQWKRYFLLVIILSQMHQSALIFIPLYFIARREIWNKSFWTVIIFSIMLIVIFRPMLGLIVSLLDKTVYSNYGQDMLTNTGSINIIRIFIAVIPIILSYFAKDKIRKEWPGGNVFVYMSLFNFVFMLFSTQYLYFYRFSMYFDLYNIVLLPRLIGFFDKKKYTALYVYVCIFYLIFSWYQIGLYGEHYKNILML